MITEERITEERIMEELNIIVKLGYKADLLSSMRLINRYAKEYHEDCEMIKHANETHGDYI